jgi:hypothetical protein
MSCEAEVALWISVADASRLAASHCLGSNPILLPSPITSFFFVLIPDALGLLLAHHLFFSVCNFHPIIHFHLCLVWLKQKG